MANMHKVTKYAFSGPHSGEISGSIRSMSFRRQSSRLSALKGCGARGAGPARTWRFGGSWALITPIITVLSYIGVISTHEPPSRLQEVYRHPEDKACNAGVLGFTPTLQFGTPEKRRTYERAQAA